MALAKRQNHAADVKRQILLVDDHPVVRFGMAQLISSQPDLAVCGECGTAQEAISAVRRLPVDLAILDISLGDTSGIQLVKEIRALNNSISILIASVHDEELYAERIIRGGAHGYISKEAPPDQFISAIHRVLAGQVYLSPKMSSQFLGRLVGGEREGGKSSVESLSDRELEVFQLIGNGLRTRDIAKNLCLSIKTIDTYREHIKTKLGLDHSADLVRCAVHWQLHGERSSSMGEPPSSASPATPQAGG